MALTLIQHVAGADGANPGTNTFTVTVASTGAGRLLVVGVLLFDAAHRSVSGVSDGTNAFTQYPGAARVINAGTFDGVTLDCWYLPSSTSGKTAITVTCSGATSFKELWVWEVSGFTTPVTDGVDGADDLTGSGTDDTGKAIVTTSTTGFLVGVVGESNGISVNPKAGNEFSTGGDIRGSDAGCSLISSTAASHQPVWTSTTSASHYCTVTAAFKEFVAGGVADTYQPPIAGLGTLGGGQRTAGTRARLAQQLLFHLPQDTSFAPPPLVAPFVPEVPGQGVAFRESKLDYVNRALYSTVTLWGGGGDITILQPDTYQPPVVGERALQASTTAFRQRSAQAQRLSWLVDNAVTSAAAVVPPYQAPLLGERLLASALRQQALRAQLATSGLIFTPSDASTALPQPDTYQPPVVGERALQASTRAFALRSTQSNALLWPVAQDPAFVPVTVVPVPGVGAWAAALQRQQTQARLATTLLILAPSVTSGLTVQPDTAIQPIPGLGVYAASQQAYRLGADRANRVLWTVAEDTSVAGVQPQTYQPPLLGEGAYLRTLRAQRLRTAVASTLLWTGSRDAVPPSTFHAGWLVNLNQEIGPTPQEPSPR